MEDGLMLKRIQSIRSVGCFINAQCAPIQFEPLTFIYAENCYGKSTLCDILRSLEEHNAEYIRSRKSVPNPPHQKQRVQLTVSIPDQDNETLLTFGEADGWVPSLPNDLRILVFDTEFIHRNVFTGLSIERKNHENITRFVFGEASVRVAQEIGELKSQLNSVRRRISDLEKNVFKGVADLQFFLQLKSEKGADDLRKQILVLDGQIQTKMANAQDMEKARGRPEPVLIVVRRELKDFVDEVNRFLECAFHGRAHETASEIVMRHLRERTTNTRVGEPWVHQGLALMSGKACPFCGQSFGEEALALLECYKSHFDKAFDLFTAQAANDMAAIPKRFVDFQHADTIERLHLNEKAIGQYPELAQQSSYTSLFAEYKEAENGLEDAVTLWRAEHDQLADVLAQTLKEKAKALNAPAEKWPCGKSLHLYDELLLATGKYNKALAGIVGMIHRFKAGLDHAVLTREMEEISAEKARLDLHERRQQMAAACDTYLKDVELCKALEKEIARLDAELERNQSVLVDEYFSSMDAIFAKLGSEHFEIAKRMSRHGNMPVIQLSARFAGVPVTTNSVKYFFSESDRRALALSLFWAKAESLPAAEKSRTILIFDDPVTSFDDGRVERTIRLMESKRNEFRQVIVLSHYTRYLRSFFQMANHGKGGIRVIRLVKRQNGSQLELGDPCLFTGTQHQQKYAHIEGFVKREHNEDVSLELRVYLANEIEMRFRRQIHNGNLTGLGLKELIDGLFSLGAIDEEQAKELHRFRETLNPDHHEWTDRKEEEKIGLVADVLDFIYSKL